MAINIEVADIFRQFEKDFRSSNSIPSIQRKAIYALQSCRTATLGKHSIKVCDSCHEEVISYNSCRNRHCPKCQFLRTEKWVAAQKKNMLPVNYFHATFTMPHELNPLFLMNKRLLYELLLKSVATTLTTLAKDPKWLGADIGFILVLHTWTQKLLDHFHVHCIIPSGGLSFDRTNWVHSKYDKFLIPIHVLSTFFKKTFLYSLQDLVRKDKLQYGRGITDASTLLNIIDKLFNVGWNVNIKVPFDGPNGVINYLGRYTHRIAISNSRIKNLVDGNVTFSYQDRSDNNKTKLLTISAVEVIRRFLLHVLPHKFIKIRHYGILGTRNRHVKLALAKLILGVNPKMESEKEIDPVEIIAEKFGLDISLCPHCKKGHLVTTVVFGFAKRKPP